MASKTPTVLIGNKKVKFSERDYVAAGGEGSVWRQGQVGVKIYHDPNKMIPTKKIQELSSITPKNVIAPCDIVKDYKTNSPIGFSFRFIDQAHPLCKIFTSKFRTKVGFNENNAVDLVKMMQQTVSQVHNENFLIVDLNEMNFLVDKKLDTAYFIDVDSWQTPTFKATALMESVRDRLVRNNQFTQGSDWFSFAVVAFQIYIGIHPYKGKHPDFLPKEWSERMDKGISVLDPKVFLPGSCRPLSVIPPAHMKWFEAIFVKNERVAPPLPDGIGMIPGTELVVVIVGNEKFDIKTVGKYPENVISVYRENSENYTITRKSLYVTSKGGYPVVEGLHNYDKTLICESSSDKPYLCKLKDGKIEIEELFRTTKVNPVDADDMMVREGRLYTSMGDSICEVSFHKGASQVLHTLKIICEYSKNSTQIFDGVIYSDILGRPFFCIPYKKGFAFNGQIAQIEGHRVLDAKSEGNILVVLTEKDGSYQRFIVVFSSDFRTYTVRKIEDVDYEPINFTKIEGGPCVLIAGGKAEIFVDNSKVKEVDNPPFDAEMKMFNFSGKVYFINKNEIYSAKMK